MFWKRILNLWFVIPYAVDGTLKIRENNKTKQQQNRPNFAYAFCISNVYFGFSFRRFFCLQHLELVGVGWGGGVIIIVLFVCMYVCLFHPPPPTLSLSLSLSWQRAMTETLQRKTKVRTTQFFLMLNHLPPLPAVQISLLVKSYRGRSNWNVRSCWFCSSILGITRQLQIQIPQAPSSYVWLCKLRTQLSEQLV